MPNKVIDVSCVSVDTQVRTSNDLRDHPENSQNNETEGEAGLLYDVD